jgi:hypothetical protein
MRGGEACTVATCPQGPFQLQGKSSQSPPVPLPSNANAIPTDEVHAHALGGCTSHEPDWTSSCAASILGCCGPWTALVWMRAQIAASAAEMCPRRRWSMRMSTFSGVQWCSLACFDLAPSALRANAVTCFGYAADGDDCEAHIRCVKGCLWAL